MLKTLTSRLHENPAGEPDAPSRPRDAGAGERAPWRSTDEQLSRAADRLAEARDLYIGGAAHPATHSRSAADVRDLARTIERRRTASPAAGATSETGRMAEPARTRTRAAACSPDRPGGARRTEPRGELGVAPGATDALAALSREIAKAADKDDVARIEEMLAVVLQRLAALEARRTERSASPPPVEEGPSDAEARWVARRARARAAVERKAHPPAAASTAAPARTGAAPRRLWS